MKAHTQQRSQSNSRAVLRVRSISKEPKVPDPLSRHINIASYQRNHRGYFRPVTLAESSTEGIRILSEQELRVGDLFLADMAAFGGAIMVYCVTDCSEFANTHSISAELWSTIPDIDAIQLEERSNAA